MFEEDFKTMTVCELIAYRDECWDILTDMSIENDRSDEGKIALCGARAALEEIGQYINRTKLLLSL